MVSEREDPTDDTPSDEDAAVASDEPGGDEPGGDELGGDEPYDSTDTGPVTDADMDDETEAESVADVTDVTDDEQTWAVVLHASALSGLVVPFGNVLGPLLLWLIKRDESEFLDASGKEVLNFQLTWTLLLLGAVVSLLIGIGFLLVPIVVVAWLVIVVLATIRASEKEIYDYPFTLDLIK